MRALSCILNFRCELFFKTSVISGRLDQGAPFSSLYEAVAQGLAAFRKNEWVEGIEERFGTVKVPVAEVRVEHQVKIADFMKWLERPSRTPREVSQRHRIREILGMSVSR